MKNLTFPILILLLLSLILISCGEDNAVETAPPEPPPNMTLFDNVQFYNSGEIVTEKHHSGIKRTSNSSYVTKLSKSELGAIGDDLELEVIIGAACDNYDRIGGVSLILLKKGDPYFSSLIVDKIEIARFITPFMDKNKMPDQVPYYFEMNNIAKLFNDTKISSQYDFWIELYVSGSTIAGVNEVAGCAGSNRTFLGTLKLNSTKKATNTVSQSFLKIVTNHGLNLSTGSDDPGRATKTFEVDVPSTLTNTKIYLITSNHGSGSGGEEYVRRNHYIYFDDILIATYKPGGKSCEPYRKYNTQGNGIYGREPRSTSGWTSWNNWCPGDKIPIRVYDIGNLAKGNHKFKIDVPDAEFNGGWGSIPVSAYLQGDM